MTKINHNKGYIMSSTQESETTDVRLFGQVKWFNNKAGYGFITVSDGEHAGKDIFIHFSTIRVTNSQYKYLVQGEYVEFSLVKSNNETHQYQATDISGLKGGPLMCETRRSVRQVDHSLPRRYKTVADSSAPHRIPESGEYSKPRRRGPRPGPRPSAATAPVAAQVPV